MTTKLDKSKHSIYLLYFHQEWWRHQKIKRRCKL